MKISDFVYTVKKDNTGTFFCEKIEFKTWLIYAHKVLFGSDNYDLKLLDTYKEKINENLIEGYYESLNEALSGQKKIAYYVPERIFNPLTKYREKIIIPKSLLLSQFDEFYEKEKNAIIERIKHEEKKFTDKKNRQIETLKKERNEIDRHFLYLNSDNEILAKWEELGKPMPAPSKIVSIKKRYKCTWNELLLKN